MIKSSTKLLKALMLLVVAFWATFESYADSPRKVVVEQHTSTTCGPCAAANPAFHEWIDQNLDYVVPLIFHQNFPAPGDPMYTHNPSMNLFFWQRFGAQGIPTCNVNGGPATHPTTLRNQNYAPITSLKGTISKVDISVELEESGNNYNAKVTVSSSIALNNHIMRAIVIEHPIDYPSAPGSNGEKHFPWVPRKAMVETGQYGEALSLAAGQSKTFEYTFAKNSAWQAGKISLSAYVQDNGTKEILQGESSQFGVQTSIGDRYLKAAPGNLVETTIGLSNSKSFEIDATISINQSLSSIPNGWTSSVSSNALKVASGGSNSFKVAVTPAQNSLGLARIAVDISSKSGSKTGITKTEYVYVLNTSTKLAVYMSGGANVVPIMQSWNSNSKYRALPAFIPLDDVGALGAYDASNFQHILIMEDDKTGYNFAANGPFVGSVINALNNKKNVALLSGFNYVAATAKDANGNFVFQTSNEVKTFFTDYVKVNSLGFFNLIQNNQLFTLPLTGVTADPISDNLPLTLNQYNANTFPYYMQYVPALQTTSAETKGVFNANNNGTPVPVGVRREFNGTKLVYIGFGLDVIADKSSRDLLLTRILEYIAPITVGDKPTISVASSVKYDDTEVGKSSTKSVEIQNTGKAMLVIDKLGLAFDTEGTDKIFTYDVKLPINIPAGGKASINVSFNPKVVDSYIDYLDIYSNDEDNSTASVALEGNGIAGSSETPVITVSKQAIAFGKVGVNSTKKDFVAISNAGKENLVINEIFMNSLDGIFVIADAPSLPLTVKTGETYELNVEFTPKAGQTYTNTLNIKSNSSSNATQTIAISGEGDATSVRDGEAGDDQVFTFSVGPNPFESSAVVTYNVAATVGAQNVSLNLVDTKGNVVKSIINGQVEMGSYTIDMTSAGLSSGAYMLVANVGANTYTLPVTIKK